jgi:hypothetical protein
VDWFDNAFVRRVVWLHAALLLAALLMAHAVRYRPVEAAGANRSAQSSSSQAPPNIAAPPPAVMTSAPFAVTGIGAALKGPVRRVPTVVARVGCPGRAGVAASHAPPHALNLPLLI